MKRVKPEPGWYEIPVSSEEYLLFANQGEEVRRLYRMARICMAALFPAAAIAAVFHPVTAAAVSAVCGLILFRLLKSGYGKGAVAPLVSALAGTAAGYFFLSRLISQAEHIREAYGG